jgi:hypothetical protein
MYTSDISLNTLCLIKVWDSREDEMNSRQRTHSINADRTDSKIGIFYLQGPV